jgi:hypothetical protein
MSTGSSVGVPRLGSAAIAPERLIVANVARTEKARRRESAMNRTIVDFPESEKQNFPSLGEFLE